MIESVWKEFNEKKKNKEWFKRILTDIQSGGKQWLIKADRYNINRSFAEGTYDVGFATKKYDSFNVPGYELNIDFTPLDLFGNREKAITSILEKMDFAPRARCTDPTAQDKRDQDIDLLKAEKALEPVRKQLAQAIGMQGQLSIAQPEDFNSDVSPIKKMNLDISNPIDEGIFKEYLQRLVWEIALEIGMEHYLNQNQYLEKFKLLAADLINHNCCASQVIASSYSGEPQYMYIYPFNAYTILAKQNDGKDAIGKGWEQPLEIRKIIGLMGKEITVDDLEQLLAMVNSSSGSSQYAGIWFPEGYSYPIGQEQKNCCEWNAFLNMTGTLGYLEVKSQNSDLYLHRMEGGNLVTTKQDYDYDAPQNVRKVNAIKELKRDSDRYLEYKFYDVTYKGYYIPNTNFVFGFGKLPLAVRYGTKNELTDFSIVTQKLKGRSINEKCQPFIKHIFDLWCKIQHFINESRPSGESWDIDVVREIAKEIIGLDAKEAKVLQALKVLQNQTNTVHKKVTMPDGTAVGGDADLVKPRIRGLDPTVVQLYDLIQRDKDQIVEITGINDVLLATQQPTREAGLGVSQMALQQSVNTIYFIQSAIQKVFTDVCFNISQKVQWIVNQEKGSEAYSSVVRAIGQRNVDSIRLLGDSPPYDFSIFISWGMNAIQREKMEQITDLFIKENKITAAQAMQILNINNWKLAWALLALFEAKSVQMQQQSQMQPIQAQQAFEEQRHKNKMEEIAEENQGLKDVATINGEFGVEIEKIKAGVKMDTTHMREISRHVTTDTTHQQNMQKMMVEGQMEQQSQPTP